MSFLRVWVHAVWSTKSRIEYFNEENLGEVFTHIYNYSLSKGIFIKKVGGYYDHIHCLFSMGKNQEIAKIINLIKGESSFWINKNQVIRGVFGWQNEYLAISVSESLIQNVIQYINRQKTHHQSTTYIQEIDRLMAKYKININRQDIYE